MRLVDPAAAIYAETGEMNAGVLRDADLIRMNKTGYFAERFFFFFTSSVLTFGIIFMVALELGSWILRRKPTEH